MNAIASLFAILAVPSMHRLPAGPQTCLRYEPDTVNITGVLSRRTFFGAPGFGEDSAHDARETGFYLELPHGVCTVAARDASENTAQNDVRLVQLVLDSAGYARLGPSVGKTVTLRGMVFEEFTGHHHAPLVMTVVKQAERAKH